MFALAVLFFAVLYLLLSVLVVWSAVRVARKRHIKGWKFGAPAALVMYLIVFWDHIPTLMLHKYYCETEAGFWVYKTPEQWAEENPGVLETLEPWPASKVHGMDKVEFKLKGGEVTQFNDRFGIWSKWSTNLNGLLIDRYENGIIDVKSREFVVRSVRFLSGPRGAGIIWKSWLNQDDCHVEVTRKNIAIVNSFTTQFRMREE